MVRLMSNLLGKRLWFLRLFSFQIRFFLLQNRQGKTRLSKWYLTAPEDNERVRMEADIHRIISMRSKGHTNFVEVFYSTLGVGIN